MNTPKSFISYSWSGVEHQQWVLDLATKLRESGVDVILDKWDLREGHDSVKFMEKMVTDSDIQKVVIIANEEYAKKADNRSGGVGTETQIISKEIYENQEQSKFVAVVLEKDQSGNPFLPTYYKSRIFIDFSEAANEAESFEQLLRWIYDKPLYIKPQLGKRPSYLEETEGVSLGTKSAHLRAESALMDHNPHSSGSIAEYFELFSKNLEEFRIGEVEGEFDDAVIENINSFIPYRNEAIGLIHRISQFDPNVDNLTQIHRFFEKLIPYLSNPPGYTAFDDDCKFDNFRFIVHELFLYTISIFLKNERFEQANYLLQTKYFVDSDPYYSQQSPMWGYDIFLRTMTSLDRRKRRLNSRRLSLRADLLKERNTSSSIEFKYLLQGDFVLFIRSEIDNRSNDKPSSSSYWFPYTMIYTSSNSKTFEIFARSVSKQYFEKVKCILNVTQPGDLTKLIEAYRSKPQLIPRWEFYSFNPAALLGYSQLATSV